MSGQDLRAGFGRLAGPIVSEPDPYGRLLRRVRRRNRRRTVLAAVAAAVAIAAVVPLIPPGTDPGASRPTASASAPGPPEQPAPVDTPLARQLLDSPTRGNLAGNRALLNTITKGFLAARAQVHVDPSLTRAKVLFAEDTPSLRVVVLVFYDGDRATVRAASAARGASVPALIAGADRPDPLPRLTGIVHHEHIVRTPQTAHTDLTLLLAPAGCLTETSSDGRVELTGSVSRTWHATGTDGWILADDRSGGQRWRVTCGGTVRYLSAAYLQDVGAAAAAEGYHSEGAHGLIDTRVAAEGAAMLVQELVSDGMTVGRPRVVWGGDAVEESTGRTVHVVALTVCQPGPGCAAILQMGGTVPHRDGEPGGPGDSWMSGGDVTVGRPDLLVFRIPGQQHGVLVVGPPEVTRAELLRADGSVLARVALRDGVGRLIDAEGDASRGDGFARTRVYDAAGRVVAELPSIRRSVAEYFGEATVRP